MTNQEKFHTLVRIAGHTRTHRFKCTNAEGESQDQIALLIGDRADLAVVLLDDTLYLLSSAFKNWDALDHESILDFEIDTARDTCVVEFVSSRWSY